MNIREISPKQLRVLRWWMDASPDRKKDAIICDGAVRSGKTLFMGISFVLWAMRQFQNTQFGICGKTILSLRRNVITVILPVLRELGFVCREKVSGNVITVSFDGRENVFHLFGGKDEGSAALIQGITFGGVLMDEVALQPRSFVEQACARCSVAGSKFWFNCNPEGPGHWFYREWIQKARERNALYLHFTMKDNPSLTDAIRKRYERLYTGVFYRRFVLGEWVTAKGRVYDFFDEQYVEEVPQGEMTEFYVSCDYGTANPASFGLWGFLDGKWYRIREFYFSSREMGYQKTDEEYAEDLIGLIGGRKVKGIIVDPSAASFIETLRRRGLPVFKAKNDVVSGIRLTADPLKNRKLVICTPCEDSIREFSLYVWEEGKTGGDAPRKENDHAMDEIRYFASFIYGENTENFAVTIAHRRA